MAVPVKGRVQDRTPPTRRKPQPPQDTPEGCDAMAAADMARAAAHMEGWGRTRFEHSAVMWSRRARLLEVADAETD
ncbi:hypothetical protein [Sphingomonas alba]|uniref:Uncharacterized protein n=1 Tax=Sphingomonas alba TaxID=2908208 RepID=A0ABT0RPI7_9SPHN|nr:hypothetical protein [Sphingomonas alba]MCL6684566.1 hypothetical protein [Sphingomonas alba]